MMTRYGNETPAIINPYPEKSLD